VLQHLGLGELAVGDDVRGDLVARDAVVERYG
jgi:hypothetical protein